MTLLAVDASGHITAVKVLNREFFTQQTFATQTVFNAKRQYVVGHGFQILDLFETANYNKPAQTDIHLWLVWYVSYDRLSDIKGYVSMMQLLYDQASVGVSHALYRTLSCIVVDNPCEG